MTLLGRFNSLLQSQLPLVSAAKHVLAREVRGAMKRTLAALALLAMNTAATAQELGDPGKQKCADWLAASGTTLAHMNGWAEGYAARKQGLDIPTADLFSFMRSYCKQWPDATLFETVDMAFSRNMRRWDPQRGAQP